MSLISLGNDDSIHEKLSFCRPLSNGEKNKKNFPLNALLSESWDTIVVAMLTGLGISKNVIDAIRESTEILFKDLRVVVHIMNPLEQSVLVIVWEMLQYPTSQAIFSSWFRVHRGSIGGVARLLRSAATYESALDNEDVKVRSTSFLSLTRL